MISFVIFISLCTFTLCENDQFRLVHLAQGTIRGYKDADDGIYAFYGVPYAKAPTGMDRFKAPLPAPVWSEIFEAVDKEIVCPQSDLMNILRPSNVMKEDCLIANIYVPEVNNTILPVVIYVHGGAYVIGWGNMFTPKKLVKTKKVIAVTFNYRIGPFGFLCLGTKDVPGNAGMKDQVALIRWVKKNILSFGGNPEDITISGFSAGSSSIETLLLSNMTKGFFKTAIPESAGVLAPFGVQLDPIENAKLYAKLLKFNNTDDLDALEYFFKTSPYETLISAPVLNRTDSITVMAPCIERDVGQERFLDDNPLNILKSGKFQKLPMLYGFTNMDGLFRLPLFNAWKDAMNDKFSNFLPADLQFRNEIEKEEISEKIRQFYFGNKRVGEETILEYIYYFTDVLFSYPMLRSVKYQVEAGHNQIYLYQYSFVEDNLPPILSTNIRGANHCAQTFGILDGFWNDTIVDEKDVSEAMKQRKIYMKKIWLNFITTGRPIPEGSDLPAWPPVGANWSPHMFINTTLELKGSLLKDRAQFWDEIYEQHYRYPMPPMLPVK